MNSRHLDQTVDKVSVFTEHTFNEGLFFWNQCSFPDISLDSVILLITDGTLPYFSGYKTGFSSL